MLQKPYLSWISIHHLIFTATINITRLYTSSPLSCCTNMGKSRTVLHWMPIHVLFHNEVCSLFWQEQISAEIEIRGSILTNSQQFWNSFLVLLLKTRVWEKTANLSRQFALDVMSSSSTELCKYQRTSSTYEFWYSKQYMKKIIFQKLFPGTQWGKAAVWQ